MNLLPFVVYSMYIFDLVYLTYVV